ncbi:hypothetical protein DYBT9275_04466 [Dyadobacter sp. CECT 9275]|uniref:Uncharacterized protein n=1 Tax=Dyadobacter helix TaxID=2822344 RepID=A0A916JI48_9BACT|nr:hypothetical protein DYBT9275_04466 [Dyadobacter sp. CECT 9275]
MSFVLNKLSFAICFYKPGALLIQMDRQGSCLCVNQYLYDICIL